MQWGTKNLIMPKKTQTKTRAAAKPTAKKKTVAKKSAAAPEPAADSTGQSPDFFDSCNVPDENQSENAKFD